MPIYEYKCRNCEKEFEILTSFKQRDKVKCPQCQSADVTTRLTTFSTKTAADKTGPPPMPGPCQGCCNQQCSNFPR